MSMYFNTDFMRKNISQKKNFTPAQEWGHRHFHLLGEIGVIKKILLHIEDEVNFNITQTIDLEGFNSSLNDSLTSLAKLDMRLRGLHSYEEAMLEDRIMKELCH